MVTLSNQRKWVNVHPTYGARGGSLVYEEMPSVNEAAWSEMSEDDRCALELRFAAGILRWLIDRRPPGAASFCVDMSDVDERQHLLGSARAAGVQLDRAADGAFNGDLAPEMVTSILTCTQSMLTVTVDGIVRFEVVDYLDDTRLYVARAELGALGSVLRDGKATVLLEG
jgi:hypothetical protein